MDASGHGHTRFGLKERMLGGSLAVILVIGIASVAPGPARADHSECPRFKKQIRAMKDIGPIFRFDNFRDDKTDSSGATAGDGVPNQFSASSDYQDGEGSGHCLRKVFQPADFADGNTVLHQRIFQGVNHPGKVSGDVSVYITYKAQPGHTFKATASVNLFRDAGDFRGRLKIVGLNGALDQEGPEYFSDICREGPMNVDTNCKAEDNGEYQTISVIGEMCAETENVNVVFRAREHKTERAYGVTSLDWIKFERIPHRSLGRCDP